MDKLGGKGAGSAVEIRRRRHPGDWSVSLPHPAQPRPQDASRERRKKRHFPQRLQATPWGESLASRCISRLKSWTHGEFVWRQWEWNKGSRCGFVQGVGVKQVSKKTWKKKKREKASMSKNTTRVLRNCECQAKRNTSLLTKSELFILTLHNLLFFFLPPKLPPPSPHHKRM